MATQIGGKEIADDERDVIDGIRCTSARIIGAAAYLSFESTTTPLAVASRI